MPREASMRPRPCQPAPGPRQKPEWAGFRALKRELKTHGNPDLAPPGNPWATPGAPKCYQKVKNPTFPMFHQNTKKDHKTMISYPETTFLCPDRPPSGPRPSQPAPGPRQKPEWAGFHALQRELKTHGNSDWAPPVDPWDTLGALIHSKAHGDPY